MDGTVWCMEGWGEREHARMVQYGAWKRGGGVEGACQDGTVWYMERWGGGYAWMVQYGAWKDGGRGCMNGWYSMVHGRMGA